jgi:hypothetical protein
MALGQYLFEKVKSLLVVHTAVRPDEEVHFLYRYLREDGLMKIVGIFSVLYPSRWDLSTHETYFEMCPRPVVVVRRAIVGLARLHAERKTVFAEDQWRQQLRIKARKQRSC